MTNTNNEWLRMKNKMTIFLNIEQLKKAAVALYNTTDNSADAAFALSLEILEKEMPREEFIKFCEELEGLK